MNDTATAAPVDRRLNWRWLEFAAIYFLAPLLMAAFVATGTISASNAPNAFAALFVIAIVLTALTPGFSLRRMLLSNPVADWKAMLLFFALTAAVTIGLTWWLVPGRLFSMPRYSPDLWQRIMLYYPLLSVLPQGIIYRTLFFERYRVLFPSNAAAIAVNALAFGLAHLFFLNWVAVALTVAGGAAFGWAYLERRSFWFANVLHAFAGWSIFTTGLGTYFYHGAIRSPF
ncbi:MAG: type II CAAX prenyl endopeptidase Rce1 family protein [Minwuia sp.]|uniref:CPBP family glutamic-type intramembrane protease n=1 Tax=Minwuia sp. TaxID=2493630 RepID=UPI003A8C71E4